MLKQKDTSSIEVPIAKFTEFNQSIFYRDDIIPDSYTPLTHPASHHISPAELTDILDNHYNATKSRGSSRIPPQLLKFLGKKGTESLAHFLNDSAIN